MIRINNLHKSFVGNRVLRGVNLEIEDGETITIIGGSGCGKSVLLKHIVGLALSGSCSIRFFNSRRKHIFWFAYVDRFG